MNKRVRFLKPFLYSDIVTVGMAEHLFTISANANVEGYINEDLFTALDGLGLVEEIV